MHLYHLRSTGLRVAALKFGVVFIVVPFYILNIWQAKSYPEHTCFTIYNSVN
jgi:hypothetical protein